MVAGDLALSPALVGVFVGLIYAGSMAGSLASGGFVLRFGAIRVSQVCVLLCAAGIAIVSTVAAAPSPLIGLLVLAPLVLGLGYGPITPASSHVLIRTAPPSRLALTFSIKQTGVPAGAALAGALLPRTRACGRLARDVRRGRRARRRDRRDRAGDESELDDDRQPSRPLSIGAAFAPLKLVFGLACAHRACADRFRLCGDAGLPRELSRRLSDGDALRSRSSPRASR